MKFYPLIFNLIFIFLLTICGESLHAQVEFIENKGQWDSRVKFMSNAGDGSFFLTENGFTISQYKSKDLQNIKDRIHGMDKGDFKSGSKSKNDIVKSHAYSVSFLNGSAAAIKGEKPLATVNNYFIGNDPSKWASNCCVFQAVTYHNVYHGIDIRYYVDGASNLKYDIIVKPGGRVEDIAMKYSGADKIETKNRELIITTPLGKSRELKPFSFQTINNQKEEVECRYEIKGDVVKFKIKNYSPQETLVIDPTLIFFSYSGSVADNWGFTATYGPDGSFYGGGIVFGQGFPVSPGSYDQSFESDRDIGIIKLSPDGSKRIYATYIGGNGSEQPHSLIVDSQGNLILAGRTNSSDYPCLPARNAAVSGVGGQWDICVTKLNAAGSALIGSMRIGGAADDGVNIRDDAINGVSSLKRNYGDDARSEVILDGANNIYVASSSSSTTSSFPTTSGVIQKINAGMQDAVILKLSPNCDNILLSTLLGGSGNDAAYVLTIGQNGNIYVAGGTASDNLKGISPSGVIKSTYLPSLQDECDGYVIELNNNFSAAVNGTYIGTTSADQVYGIETDKNGFIYIMGTSEGNMPVINAAYSVPGSKQFISKLAKDLSAYIYTTIFGSPNSFGPNISPTAFLVDRCENVYVSGWGGKPDNSYKGGNTIGMPTTAGAIKAQTDPSGSDFYFFVLEKNAVSQLYGSFFGQNDPMGTSTFGDHVDGGTSRFDRNGVIYQAICANCGRSAPFPGTPGSWSPTNLSEGTNGTCNLGMLKIEMNFSGIRAGLRTSIDGVPNDTSGCVPLTVNFSDTVKLGKLYYWNFGDGTGDTTTIPTSSHVYNAIGTYLVRLISIDSMTCNIADTSYKNIRVGNIKVNLDFTTAKIPPCTNLSYQFTNTSTGGAPFKPNTFTWDFGDNSAPLITSYAPSFPHTYAGPGTYQVKLTINDTTFCNSPEDTVKTIRLSPQVKALFTTPDKGCAPYSAVFKNNSLGGLQFQWFFGDGSSSNVPDPTHLYNLPGTYVVKLVAFDSSSCNKVDSAFFSIKVSPKPTAAFTFSPLSPVENQATMFINQSLGATNYLWNFGDGDTSVEVNPSHIFNATDTYTVCLKASNDAGCQSDTCKPVKSLINPLLDVPSAFTPGRFGINSQIKVVGFGIKEMIWTIYNRWGQKVYESNNRKSSWDGTFNGKLQPTDVYTYTLKVTFSNGTKAVKTGDITLLR